VNLPLVTSVGVQSFQSCTKMELLILPKVTSIGAAAFCNMTRLFTTIYLPEAITIDTAASPSISSTFPSKTVIIKTPTGNEYTAEKQVLVKELFGAGGNVSGKIARTFAQSENPIPFP
jgi:hypothetical protein